jgi:hypothetical protein
MAFKINEIISGLRFGGARPNLFKVRLQAPPRGLGLDFTGAEFLIQATSLPASEIAAIEVPYFGRKVKVAGDREYGTWAIDVMNDEDFKIRNQLENWHYKINSIRENINNTGSSAPANYKADAFVDQYAKTGDVIRTYKFEGLFPTSIDAISLNWETNNTIETFGVTFAYDYYVVTGTGVGDMGSDFGGGITTLTTI